MKCILFFLTLMLSYAGYAQIDKVNSVSFIHLLANQKQYDKKRVLISGFLHVKFEDNVLYLSKEHGDFLLNEGIWINYDSTFMKNNDLKKFDRKFVDIIGIVDANEGGHSECCLVSLDNVIILRIRTKAYK